MARLAGPQDPESPFLLPNVVITGILPHTAFTWLLRIQVLVLYLLINFPSPKSSVCVCVIKPHPRIISKKFLWQGARWACRCFWQAKLWESRLSHRCLLAAWATGHQGAYGCFREPGLLGPRAPRPCGHVGVWGLCCLWGHGVNWARPVAEGMLPMTLMRQGYSLMSMETDDRGLGHNQWPCWHPRAILPLGPWHSV